MDLIHYELISENCENKKQPEANDSSFAVIVQNNVETISQLTIRVL